MQKDQLRKIWDRHWLPRVSARTAFYGGVAQYYQSCVCNKEKRIGEEIARGQAAIDQLKTAQSRFTIGSATMAKLCNTIIEKATAALATAKKDNDFIHHDQIPEVGTSLPFITLFSDLFEELAPASVQNAIQGYETRKAALINLEIGQLREATQLLNGALASLNRPDALEESQGQALPPSLKERATYVRTSGGIESIDRQLKEQRDMFFEHVEILTEIDQMLSDEKASDDQLRAQFGSKWTRATSDSLTEKFRTDLAKYREKITHNRTVDRRVKSKYVSAKDGIELLSLPEEQLAKRLPTESSSLSPAAFQELMSVVREVQREREVLEKEFVSKTVDVKAAFAADEGNVDGILDLVYPKILDQAYGPLQARALENLAKQKTVLEEIEEVGDGKALRSKLIEELATAGDTYQHLKKYFRKGVKVDGNLKQQLDALKSEVSDYVFKRKTEKEENLKGLTSSIAASQHGSPPNAPRYHEELKQPPPRPLPPAPTLKEQPPQQGFPPQQAYQPQPNPSSGQGFPGQYLGDRVPVAGPQVKKAKTI
ncbi:hypothetical protein QYM36_006086 [Artemia franciscana]|uniref:BRO1 domain-containing protein n=1 Tax=Artemia franciscana TaxID=6661 RepID=A0AA88HZT0_ARTSF|nr:hypothetical protein QYM36_006086 [Artemia franciscana]